MKKSNETRSDCLLWGRKLRGFFKAFSDEYRKDYGLKQIDLEILFYLHYNPEASIGEISRNQSLNKGQLSLAMTDLKEMAKFRGIKGVSTMKKADIIEAMVQKDEEEDN